MRKTRGGWGKTGLPHAHFSRRHRTLSQVARVLFRSARFNTSPLYILSESLAQATMLRVLLATFKPVLQQFRLLQVAKNCCKK